MEKMGPDTPEMGKYTAGGGCLKGMTEFTITVFAVSVFAVSPKT
jgi:hypothetical protein